MPVKTRIVLVIACLAASFGGWIAWGVYTADHMDGPLTWGYATGSAATILGPLVVALVLLATGT
jgi:hypothetical protein